MRQQVRVRQYPSDTPECTDSLVGVGQASDELERAVDLRRQRRRYEGKISINRPYEAACIVNGELRAVHETLRTRRGIILNQNGGLVEYQYSPLNFAFIRDKAIKRLFRTVFMTFTGVARI